MNPPPLKSDDSKSSGSGFRDGFSLAAIIQDLMKTVEKTKKKKFQYADLKCFLEDCDSTVFNRIINNMYNVKPFQLYRLLEDEMNNHDNTSHTVAVNDGKDKSKKSTSAKKPTSNRATSKNRSAPNPSQDQQKKKKKKKKTNCNTNIPYKEEYEKVVEQLSEANPSQDQQKKKKKKTTNCNTNIPYKEEYEKVVEQLSEAKLKLAQAKVRNLKANPKSGEAAGKKLLEWGKELNSNHPGIRGLVQPILVVEDHVYRGKQGQVNDQPLYRDTPNLLIVAHNRPIADSVMKALSDTTQYNVKYAHNFDDFRDSVFEMTPTPKKRKRGNDSSQDKWS